MDVRSKINDCQQLTLGFEDETYPIFEYLSYRIQSFSTSKRGQNYFNSILYFIGTIAVACS